MKLFHKIYGEEGKDTIIILHGLFGMLDNWHNMATRLSSSFRVITVDQRNHGQSPHSDVMNYEVMAGDLRELVDDLGISDILLLGHSMGGKTAMRFALDYPEKVKKLAVADMAPRSYGRGHDKYFEAMFSLDLASVQTRGEAERVLAEKVPDDTIRLFLMKNLGRTKEGQFAWKMNLQALYDQYDKISGELSSDKTYTGPALFISGALSDYIQDRDRQDIKKLFPAATFASVPGAGHWVHAENPEGFYNVLNSFLTS